MMRRTFAVIAAAVAVLVSTAPAGALYHLVVIDEVLTGYNGDPDVQFVELRMLATIQNFATHSIFAAFDADGTYVGDILEVPGDLANSFPDLRWIIGTADFQAVSGLTPDFIMPAGILPTSGGMVCYGAPASFSGLPQNPPTWDRTNFANYADCLAYGTYSGPSNPLTGAPTPLDGNGHGLQRVLSSNDNASDFICGAPLTPQNNAGATVTLPITTLCSGCAAVPDVSCVDGFDKASLQIKETAGKEALRVKMIGGPFHVQTDLGNPITGGTAYNLCVFGDGAIVAQIGLDRAGDDCAGAPCWKALGGDPPDGKGYKYKDGALSAGGLFQVLYKGGAAGKSKALIKGRGAGLPNDIANRLQGALSATVQLRGSNAGQCLSVTVTDIVKQEVDFFKARR